MSTRNPPLTVIGGYLGAGKTTLLNRMLTEATGQRIAVIVNDFGAINIDAGLVKSREEETISLTNGCMCCSASNGTATALATLLNRADLPDRIVIEASGVSEPGKIAQNAFGFRLQLDGVIVLADAEQLLAQASNRYVGDVVRRQLRQADLILLNKVDLTTPDGLQATRARIAEIAPDRAVIETSHSSAPLDVLLGLPSEARYGADGSQDGAAPARWATHAPDHASRFRSWLVEPKAPLTRVEFNALASDLTARAVRAKGHVVLADEPGIRFLYQQVGKRWTLQKMETSAEPGQATRIVAISCEPGAVTAIPSDWLAVAK